MRALFEIVSRLLELFSSERKRNRENKEKQEMLRNLRQKMELQRLRQMEKNKGDTAKEIIQRNVKKGHGDENPSA